MGLPWPCRRSAGPCSSSSASSAGKLGSHAEIRVVRVPDQAAAERLRFLGSPSIRVNGRDIEPGAERNVELVHGCRLYQGTHSLHGLPEEDWLRQALDNPEAQP
jgi:hypothetical protein